MLKVKQTVKNLSLEELNELMQYIDSGKMKKYVSDKIDDNIRQLTCATCHSEFKDNGEGLQLIFGPPDFKKRANFCALDCMEYFIAHLKKMREDDIRRTEQQVE